MFVHMFRLQTDSSTSITDLPLEVLLSILQEVLRYGVGPLQTARFGKQILDPERLRLLVFGLALVLVMRFKPAGLWPSPERKRELTEGP